MQTAVAGAPALALALSCVGLAGCTALFAYPGDGAEALCADGVDNDGDGRTDCYDTDCEALCQELCNNGIDDNRDGLIDCADPTCNGNASCESETGARECSNRFDDDGDGLTDCEDRGCDGHCPEETLAECSDSRDNDEGDNSVDGADPRCWLVLPSRVQRCASVGGSTFEAPLASLEDTADVFYATGAPLNVREPPRLGPVLALSEGTTLGTREAFAGDWNGASIELLIQGEAELLFALASATGVDTPAFAARPFFRVAVSGTTLTLETVGEAFELPLGTRSGWQLLRVDVEEGALQASLLAIPEIGTGDSLRLSGPAVSGAIAPARLLLSGPGLFSELRVVLGRSDPCEASVPPLDEPIVNAGLDVSAAWTSTRGCALAVGCRPFMPGTQLYAYTSLDGLAWSLERSVDLGWMPAAVGVAWSPDQRAFYAAVPDATGALHVLRSEDCSEWSEEQVLPSIPVSAGIEVASCRELQGGLIDRTVSYVVRGDLNRDLSHEIYWTTGSGEQTRFVRTVAPSAENFGPPEPFGPALGRGTMFSLTSFGGDDVVARLVDPAEGENGLRLDVLVDGALRRVPGPAILPPSGVAGSFDRDAVRSVAVLPPRSLFGVSHIVMGALGDYEVPDAETRAVRIGGAELRFAAEGD